MTRGLFSEPITYEPTSVVSTKTNCEWPASVLWATVKSRIEVTKPFSQSLSHVHQPALKGIFPLSKNFISFIDDTCTSIRVRDLLPAEISNRFTVTYLHYQNWSSLLTLAGFPPTILRDVALALHAYRLSSHLVGQLLFLLLSQTTSLLRQSGHICKYCTSAFRDRHTRNCKWCTLYMYMY